MARRQNLQKTSFLLFTRDVCRPLNQTNSDSSVTLPVFAYTYSFRCSGLLAIACCMPKNKMHVCQFWCNWNVCNRRSVVLSVYWLLCCCCRCMGTFLLWKLNFANNCTKSIDDVDEKQSRTFIHHVVTSHTMFVCTLSEQVVPRMDEWTIRIW